MVSHKKKIAIPPISLSRYIFVFPPSLLHLVFLFLNEFGKATHILSKPPPRALASRILTRKVGRSHRQIELFILTELLNNFPLFSIIRLTKVMFLSDRFYRCDFFSISAGDFSGSLLSSLIKTVTRAAPSRWKKSILQSRRAFCFCVILFAHTPSFRRQ